MLMSQFRAFCFVGPKRVQAIHMAMAYGHSDSIPLQIIWCQIGRRQVVRHSTFMLLHATSCPCHPHATQSALSTVVSPFSALEVMGIYDEFPALINGKDPDYQGYKAGLAFLELDHLSHHLSFELKLAKKAAQVSQAPSGLVGREVGRVNMMNDSNKLQTIQ